MLRFILIFGLISPLLAPAQEARIPSDTLREVTVSAYAHNRFNLGAHPQVLDSLLDTGQSLPELLNEQSFGYIKTYGSGMLASAAVRGTAASHTAVLWNGLPLNSPSLGQADLSLYPGFAFSQARLQPGGSSSLYGSGAIGGALQLSTTPSTSLGWQLHLAQKIGSYGARFSGAKAAYGTKTSQLSLGVYQQQKENNFPYSDPYTGKTDQRMEHAAWNQQGIVQNFRHNFQQQLEINQAFWLQKNWRQNQPVMGSSSGDSEQEDASARFSLQAKKHYAWGNWLLQTAISEDGLHYQQGQVKNDFSSSIRQLLAQASFWPLPTLEVEAGSQYLFSVARSENFLNQSATQQQTDVFLRSRWQPTGQLLLSGTYRQAVYDGQLGPATPALGMHYQLFPAWSARSQLSRNYRLPTLNDRFWLPKAQQEIQPEHSWQTEIGLDGSGTLVGLAYSVQLTAYRMLVDDWIVWLPEGGVDENDRWVAHAWVAVNYRKVRSQGVELAGGFSSAGEQHTTRLNYQLAYTHTTNQSEEDPFTFGHQLPYVPRWKGQLSLCQTVTRWEATLSLPWSSRRFTNLRENSLSSLEAYALLNAQLGYRHLFKKHALNIQLKAHNLLNQTYQLYENRPMPGREFTVRFTYLFSTTS